LKISQVAPELRAGVRRMPPLPLGSRTGRWLLRRLLGRLRPVTVPGVRIEVRQTHAQPVRIYLPERRDRRGALLWIHGGGYLLGTAAQDDRFCAETAAQLGIVVVSADYRMAPEHPFPAPSDDCLAAWNWLQAWAHPLGVDRLRIAVGGQSAGGGLAAGLVQRLHDAASVEPVAQWLLCPMLDDRTAARRELDSIRHFIWNNRSNAIGWSAFLGQPPGAAEVPDYAAPARRTDLSGLPNSWIGVGDIDLFHAEDEHYAQRLMAAGVPTEFVSVAGAPHGFEGLCANTDTAQRYLAAARDWLGRALTAD